MVKKIFAQTYLWILLLLLYSPIVIIVIYSFTEAKVLGNWTGFSATFGWSAASYHIMVTPLVYSLVCRQI